MIGTTGEESVQIAQISTGEPGAVVACASAEGGVLDLLDVKYHDVLESPATIAARLATFLGSGFDAARAAAAVDPSLRHERA